MTENADLQSRVVELQSRHQVKGSVLVYECRFTHFCFAECCADQGQGVGSGPAATETEGECQIISRNV